MVLSSSEVAGTASGSASWKGAGRPSAYACAKPSSAPMAAGLRVLVGLIAKVKRSTSGRLVTCSVAKPVRFRILKTAAGLRMFGGADSGGEAVQGAGTSSADTQI